MYQEPDSTCYMQPLLGQAPSEELFYQVNSYVTDAVQAVLINDAKNLHRAYVNIGIVLGIDKTCTNIVQNYSKNFKVPPREGFQNSKTMFKKDSVNLEGMLANIDIEQKIVHIQHFMRRRRIPEYVIRTLHVPKRVDDDETAKGMREVQDSTCQAKDSVVCQTVTRPVKHEFACQVDEKSVKQNSACQTVDELVRLDVACQTLDNVMRLDVACQTPRLHVACQTVEKYAHQEFSCQTMEISDCKKALSDELVCKDTDSRKRERLYDEPEPRSTKRSSSYSKRLDSTSNRDATKRSTYSRESDAKPSPKYVEERKHGDGVARVRNSEAESRTSKRSSPYSKPSEQRCESSDHKVTKLVIKNLHPKVNDEDICAMFDVFKSYKFSMVNYCSAGKSLGTAEVVFRDKADAMEAKNEFDGQKLDGLPISIVVVESESN